MEIIINDNRRITDIQKEFSNAYPFLKVEFFTVSHSKNKLSSLKNMIPNDRLLGSFRNKHNSGGIFIYDSKTVFEIEEEFATQFGLYVQVFRKSGSLWIETSLTDKWSVAFQNSEGCEISKSLTRTSFYKDDENVMFD